jgi:glycosyltransferase involved in cell wall biosynthesis
MKTISICIPVFNEEENIENTYEKITNLFQNKLSKYDYEIIFTDNHSSDKTEEIITSLCKKNNKVKYIRFRANLEYDKSILEGYKNSVGDAAIVIDCDLQDPPEMFEKFIYQWENHGKDVVFGVVNSRKENFIENFFRKLFYYVMNYNTESKYPLNAHDFRLVDRKVLNNLKDTNNLFPFVRGLTFSLSESPYGIEYDRSKRNKGKSKLGFYKTFTYAINAFLEETFLFSKIFRRLTLILLFGFIIFTIINVLKSFLLLSFFNNIMLGMTMLICMLLTIICEYCTRIYFQLKKTPRVIYEKKINF